MTPPAPSAGEPTPVQLHATLQARGPAAAVILDEAQFAAIGADTKTPPIRVTVNGHTFTARVGRMRGETMIGFNRAVREACGVAAGDEIEVTVVLDQAPREVDVPAALMAALSADPSARAAFDRLAYTHRKEFARWIGEAKREETRERRVAKALSMLHDGQTIS